MNLVWEFPALHVARDMDGRANVVTAVDWRLTATDADGHAVTATGRAGLDPAPDDFTDFDSLTAAQVQGWVETQLGDDLPSVKSSLEARLAELVNPPLAILSPPWAASSDGGAAPSEDGEAVGG